MGKRKYSDDEDHIARKIKKFENKMDQLRRKRRKDSWSCESSEEVQWEEEVIDGVENKYDCEQGVQQHEGTWFFLNIL